MVKNGDPNAIATFINSCGLVRKEFVTLTEATIEVVRNKEIFGANLLANLKNLPSYKLALAM